MERGCSSFSDFFLFSCLSVLTFISVVEMFSVVFCGGHAIIFSMSFGNQNTDLHGHQGLEQLSPLPSPEKHFAGANRLTLKVAPAI